MSMLVYARVLKKKKWDFTCPLESNGVHLLKWILLFHLVGGCCISFRWAVYLILEGGIMILHIRILYISCRVQLTSKIVATLQMHIYIDIYIYMYIYTYICIYIPAPGLPRVCFGIFLRVFMMTFMFISGYLQDF